MKTSDLWPVVVDCPEIHGWPGLTNEMLEEIVRRALDLKWPEYIPRNKTFIVFPIRNPMEVTFKPKTDYTVTVKNVNL
jgi:hypothetical protein